MPSGDTARRLARTLLPRPVRASLRRIAGRAPGSPSASTAGAGAAGTHRRDPTRLGPNDRGGTTRLHVGCGPTNLMADWWNVDIRWFRGVDEVADVTEPWPWHDLDYVYGEHFLEHLDVDQTIRFLAQARAGLRPGGRIRMSTPSLEWVWATHFRADGAPDDVIADTYRANRAFHGWGHRFLYSRPFLEHVLTASGLVDVRFHPFGESDDPNLRGLERHGTAHADAGWTSVWNVEAVRPAGEEPRPDPEMAAEAEREFGRYVRSGH